MEKTFTPASARRVLETVRPHAEDLTRTWRRMRRMLPARVASDRALPPGYLEALHRLMRSFKEVASTGVIVQDPGEGIFDFPARLGGREVYLCWKVGESDRLHWHEAAAGAEQRRPVDDDAPWEAAP